MLEVQQLAVKYQGSCCLDSVSFQVAPGQFVGIMGPNGAGKSTMMKAMLGLVPTVSGRVSFCTCPLCQQLERVAYVPQRSQIDWDFPVTVGSVVMMALTRSLGWFRGPHREAKQRVHAALEQVGLWDWRHRRIGALSGGQQQRVFLARALAQNADIFLFDEPFTGVDQPTEEILLEVFRSLKQQGKILMVSSHDWGKSMSQLDRLMLLNQRLIADGYPDQVMTPENLQKTFVTARGAGSGVPRSAFFC
ncbi:metal ABC transporter ATP-binding protein [Lyngbya confervoides]|uniref:Metal ABC transporter ATP-binding protein n=1 Tax=Lyngbya confervoides BDU141951 TaxID=1574623 RepID=A0ABD4T128_9CYAN|nr:metal ABC transporter ATP-binding protein [Lyngbya confervoides]MCM1982351.1 metal ABC transporter ATP-binding protein [Lyngbya confervoides BDU141951]